MVSFEGDLEASPLRRLYMNSRHCLLMCSLVHSEAATKAGTRGNPWSS